ncbi:MAG: BACON domain-containing protein [Prevotellaceae bacterium]|jgi:hypothetical protein|nr:BACON domain-containing protein [Prevotellaceae bacterium]
MKKYIIQGLLGCAALLALSCEQQEEHTLSIDYAPAAPVSSMGGTVAIAIHASGKWTASKTTSWIRLSSEAGEGDRTITITVAANVDDRLNTATRSASIYIISGAHTAALTVTQAGHDQPLPGTPTVSGDSTNQCPATSTVMLTASPVEHAVSYTWYRNGIAVQTNATLNCIVRASGVYSVAGVNFAGAEGPRSADKTVVIEACPPADASAIVGADANNCLGTTDQNTVLLTVPEIAHAETYTWYRGAQVVQRGASRSYTATESGYYSVAGSNINGTGAPSPQKQVTITPCAVSFGYGQTFSLLTCNRSLLNTPAGNSLLDPFLSVYNSMYAAVAALPRYINYISIKFNTGNQMLLTANYSNSAGTSYLAYFYFTVNTEPDGTVYFTDMQPTSGNASTVGPRMANNILKYLLYSGTGNANGTTVTASGNKFKIRWAPSYTPGVSELGGFYVVSDPSNYIPGVLGN